MVDAIGLNTGIAQLLGNGSGNSSQSGYVSGIRGVNTNKRTDVLQSLREVEENTAAKIAENPELQKFRKACQDFEAIFLHQLFKIMRQAGPKSDLLNSGFAQDVYQDMMDEQLAAELSTTGTFGLADILYEQNKQSVEAQISEENNPIKAE